MAAACRSGLEQWYEEEFLEVFQRTTGKALKGDEDKFWRFNRVYEWGPGRESLLEAAPPQQAAE